MKAARFLITRIYFSYDETRSSHAFTWRIIFTESFCKFKALGGRNLNFEFKYEIYAFFFLGMQFWARWNSFFRIIYERKGLGGRNVNSDVINEIYMNKSHLGMEIECFKRLGYHEKKRESVSP